MQNTLGDLNNHLFAQLERLNDEDLEGEALSEEIRRSEAITDVATKIIDNAGLVLKAQIVRGESMAANTTLPKMLNGDK